MTTTDAMEDACSPEAVADFVAAVLLALGTTADRKLEWMAHIDE